MRLLAVDGNSIMNRAFYGIRPLTTKDGQFTHAIYGFLTMLEKIKADTSPDAVAIAFDLHAPTFRHREYTGYKATRKGMPDELRCQVEPLKELLSLLGYRLVTCEGYEADDILGTLASACSEQGNECVIATGDRDSFQLIGGNVSVRFAATKQGTPSAEIYTADRIMKEYGVTPHQLIDVKALQGDSSDNIPGVAGIGPKGAQELIASFGNIDYIYDNLETLDIRETVKNKLRQGRDNAYLSRRLGEIYCSVPIDVSPESYRVDMTDPDAAARLMGKLELFKLIERLGLHEPLPVPEESSAAERKVSCEKVAVIGDIASTDGCVIDADFADGELERFFVFDRDTVFYSDDSKLFCQLLQSDHDKIIYDSKPVCAFADKRGVAVSHIVFDVSLAAYLLSPSATDYSPERLCAEYGIAVPVCADESVSPYRAALPETAAKLITLIEQKEQKNLLTQIEIPLANVLARMENIGFAVDARGISEYGEMIAEKLSELEHSIYDSVGYEFNINSPKQLGEALFEKLGIPTKKKTKSGYSTSADVLEGLRYQYPVVSLVLSYRTYAKLKSTYCDGLLKVIGDDNRIHSSFNQRETRTGRISSTEPNLQNIPVRTDLGRQLRRYFVAAPGWVLVDADYSQIELRVLADISGDKNMIKAFSDNTDIHTVTASQVFNMPVDMVTPVMRSRAKAVNFGIVYGIGAFSLSKDISVTNREAAQYIKSYLEHYSGVDSYMQSIIERAKNQGFVSTLFGRRRYLPELTASNFATRAFGERVARNMPIQGTAADIIKIAMIRVDERLRRENLRSRLILQVHDELIVEAPENEADYVAGLLQDEMENAVKLRVPLVAESSKGRTWYDAKG